MERIANLTGHLAASAERAQGLERVYTSAAQQSVFGKVGVASDDDVVIVTALRTAICKARKGNFRNTTPDDMLKALFEATVAKSGINPSEIDDVVVGNCQTSGSYAMPAKAAMFRAGLPETVSLRAVNRQCSSGSQAVASIAADIKAGFIEVGIACGVESMTNGGSPGDISSLPPMNMNEIFQDPIAKNVLIPMGMTSENVAEKYGITREQQDSLAVLSNNKALAAIKAGLFKDEIVPVNTIVEDKEGNETEVTVDTDEGPRAGTTLEKLAKLRPAFKKGGCTTGGNSSQVSDGAAATLLMKRSKAKALGLPILGVFRGARVVGVAPDLMGIGPAAAIPALLADTGLAVKDIDVFEINEAFASQATYCVQELAVPMEKLNPRGGAIALGHPLGATGARMTATALHESTPGQTSIVSMCVGTGMGFAMLLERA